MKNFNVLDRKTNVHKSYLLEASAGTGKTFSIENIFVRILLERSIQTNAIFTIEKILAVTFTRAAARDLKSRIRQNVEFALKCLHSPPSASTPDYLLAIQEQGDKALIIAQLCLEAALANFDNAQVFTIHSFCAKILQEYALESGHPLNKIEKENQELNFQALNIVQDYFRTKLSDEISPAQLEIVLKDHENKIDVLEKSLLQIIQHPLLIQEPKSFNMLYAQFNEALQKLNSFRFSSEDIFSDFLQQAPSYVGLCNKQGKIHSSLLEEVSYFAKLFDQKEWTISDFNYLITHGLVLCEALQPSNLKVKGKKEFSLKNPHFLSSVQEILLPIVQIARNPNAIFGRMAYSCQKMLHELIEKEELSNYDQILKKVHSALSNPEFIKNVQNNYLAVIIDEFQDTDPLQWEIFRTLFYHPKNIHLYLVGDPKQSIYAFRQADVYTYIKAGELLGEENKATLNTNFRSHPSLVYGLNLLFESPKFIELPKLGKTLQYAPVQAGIAVERTFFDSLASVQFCIAKSLESNYFSSLKNVESDYFFPFISSEIDRLHTQDKIPLNEVAILVSDRYQANRLREYLEHVSIPSLLYRENSLQDSHAITCLKLLLQATLYPKNLNYLKTALGSALNGWTLEDLFRLSDDAFLTTILLKFSNLRKELYENGFVRFYDAFLNTQWIDNSETVAEKLLSTQRGFEFFEDIQQIVEILVSEYLSANATPFEILKVLDKIQKEPFENDSLKKRRNPTEQSVNILTLHSSKGLEFEVVFTLGLITRSKAPSFLIPIENRLQSVLDENSEQYESHCQEIDAEKMRQFYVAMTRAKYRVYVPIAISPNSKKPSLGTASPMELFFARCGNDGNNYKDLYNRISHINEEKQLSLLQETSKQNGTISFVTLSEQKSSPVQWKRDTPTLECPKSINFPTQTSWIYSFSGLAKKGEIEKFEIGPPNDYKTCSKTPFTLPSNSETGNLLHQIFEKLPFQKVCEAKTSRDLDFYLSPFVQNSPHFEWTTILSDIVFDTLHFPLNIGLNSVKICEIPSAKRYHEMEFLYKTSDYLNIENVSNGYLKGIVDLIFLHEDKYYILDWKTNWLGPDFSHYHQKNAESCMQHNDYFLQSKIYTEGLKKYLQLVDPRPFSDIFGGTIYFFVRGPFPFYFNEHKKYIE